MRAWEEYKSANTVEEAQAIQETLLTKDIAEERQNSFKRLRSLMRYAAKCESSRIL